MGALKRACLILSAVLIWVFQASAQHSAFQFYGPELGLTNQSVLALHQDREGYLWAGTEGGLFRYDGDRFRLFPVETQRKRGIVAQLHNSGDGQLWAASTVGLFHWRRGHFVIEPGFNGTDLESAESIASDPDSLYVASTSGVRLLPLRGTAQSRIFSTRRSFSVMVASDHTVWYGCDSALCSARGGQTVEWGPQRGVTGGPWRYITEDADGRIWIRSMTRVLVKAPGAQAFREVRQLRGLDSTRGWQMIPVHSGPMLILHNSGLTECSGDACWTRTQDDSRRHAEILAGLVDREGSLWLGYAGHGLARWLGRNQWESFGEQEGLDELAIWRIVRDPAGVVWAGTSHGLYRGTRIGQQWRFRKAPEIGDLVVYALDLGPDGALWLGVYQTKVNGLIRYNPATHALRVYHPPQGWPPISTDTVYRDEGGTVWAATSRGLLRLSPGASHLEPYPTPLDGATVFDVRVTPQGIFAAGKKGLYIERGGTRRLLTSADGLQNDVVQSVYPRPDGSVWVDYFSPDGISRLTFTGNVPQIQHISTDDGLPSNIVYAQFFDALGRHWITTDNGVTVQDAGHWIHYDTSNGLVWNDCNTHAFLAEADGTVWIGTSGGLARYRPVASHENVLPAALITAVLRNDRPAQSLDFDAQTRALGLRFTMLSYLNQNPRFRYRIGGDSAPWSETTGHEVRLAELGPGTYDFVVQGEAAPGVWSTPASVHFRIRAPWYLSHSYQGVLAALLAAAAWWWWRNREQRQAKVRAELETAVAERTRDLAEATRRAEQANRVKGEFVANISHEMRTPLNGVLGLTQLALELNRDPAIAEHLRIAQFSARGLLNLINDVLDFSKLEAGEMQILPVAFELRPLLRDLRSMFAQEAVRQSLKLDAEVASDVPPWVLADERRLRQVLLNLVGNALKFTSSGGVSVRVTRSGDDLCFSVADTGIGIPAEKQALIFDAFRQADNSTSRRHGGTGLGLTISKRLVEGMGGKLTLESTPGKGSTFTFTVHAPAAASPAPETVPRDEPAASPMNILVAEDNRVNQYLMQALLRKMGHSVALAANGVEVLEALARKRFDLVLMDIQMPELDGLQATRRIREHERDTGEHLPVVALTARAMPGDRELFLGAGMDDYMEKPIQEERLRTILSRMSKIVQPEPDLASGSTAKPDESRH